MLGERLWAFLGYPSADVPFPPRRRADLDEVHEFPAGIVRLLNEWGPRHYYMPVRFGGQFDDFVTRPQSAEAVARRDLTVAIAHGKTFPGGVSAWVAQDDAAAQAPAGKAFGRHPVHWGLTERDHDGDLLAGEVSADAVTGGYRISGEEWLVNDATLHRVVRVLARSVRAGEESGFDKQSRDHRIVGVFDGDSTAGLHAIIAIFSVIARRGNTEVGAASGLSAPVAAFDPAKVNLRARYGCRIVRTLPGSVAELIGLAGARPGLAPVMVHAQQCRYGSNRLLAPMAGLRSARINASGQAFWLAEQFALAASVIAIWLAGHQHYAASPLWRDGAWSQAALARSLPDASTVDCGDAVLVEFARRHHEGRSFGVARPHRIAEEMCA